MNVKRGRGRRSALSEINVTPLVDVMLVLLIIFMVTAPALFRELAVNLPKSVVGQAQVQEGIVVTLSRDGNVLIDADKVALGDFAARFGQLHVRQADRPVFVRADERVPYGTVVQVMGQIKAAGVERVGLVVEEAEEPRAAPRRR
ncbi:MAG: biopolymer transporter ExbD [Candidatus Latescibacterota bacterium]